MAILKILRFVLALAAAIYLMRQVRKPTKFVGRLFARLMNFSHSGLTDWGLDRVRVEKDFTILDVGCGGGRAIQKLAALAAGGKVYGVDYAAGSVAQSRATNAEGIRAGRIKIQQASVSHLPFADNTFDLVTAVETQYYWPDLMKDMQEILRVLKPDGTLAVIAESYKKGRFDALQAPALKLLGATQLGLEEQRELFAKAGYTHIEIFEERTKGWICATGKKRPLQN